MALVTGDRGAAGTDGSLEIETNSDKIFDDAFTEAATGEKVADTDGTSGTEGMVPDDEVTPPDTSGTTQATLGTAGTTTVASTTVASTSADDTAEQRYRTLQGIHKADKKKWEAEQKARDTEIERLKAEKDALSKSTSGSTPSPDPYLGLTDKEKEELKAYDTEYDQISKMEGIKRKVELTALKGEVISTVRAEFKQAFDYLLGQIGPALSTTEEISDERHFSVIKNQHPDFEKYRDDGSIESWIDTKPKYLKDAYTSVYNEGTAQDIVDLISTFKRENNIGVATVSSTATTAGTAAPTIDKKKQEKKEALSGVHSRKTPASYSQVDASNYDGAFEEAAKKS